MSHRVAPWPVIYVFPSNYESYRLRCPVGSDADHRLRVVASAVLTESSPSATALVRSFDCLAGVIQVTCLEGSNQAHYGRCRRINLMGTVAITETKTMLTLPGDAVRQILWRFADRFDLQMLVQSARSVARGTVARLVAAGERNTHEWTPGKAEMMEAFDRAGVTAAFMEPEEGGFIAGPKNLALALAAYELAWVDGGAATASLAGFLALAPIHERGTLQQVARYKTLAAPPQAGEDRKPWRGAFALTEPIPYVGVDTSALSGKITGGG